MNIQENISLKAYNTFGIDVNARYFVNVQSKKELRTILNSAFKKYFIIGSGSNILLTKNLESLVIHINNKGKKILKKTTNDTVFVKVQAGENWHEFVLWCIANNFGGVENLSLIPGNVGTAPIQNIGAYGCELKDVFQSCKAVNIATGKIMKFSLQKCNFGYRNSIFKNEEKGKYIITSVTFKLTKKDHKLNDSYGAIKDFFKDNNITNPSIKDVSNAVIAIRQSKLPNPKELGNSGSFFKNPIVDKVTFEKLQQTNPTMPFYIVSKTATKIPAGWLIEQCGFKGERFGNVGVYQKQALVLINYGNATGKEVLSLAQKIQRKVHGEFGIFIEMEVNIIG